jgi:hypothetical protein
LAVGSYISRSIWAAKNAISSKRYEVEQSLAHEKIGIIVSLIPKKEFDLYLKPL